MESKKNTSIDIHQYIGSRLKELRRQKGFNQQAVANHISLSRASLTNIEKGRHGTTAKVLWDLCSLYKVEVGNVFPPLNKRIKTKVIEVERTRYIPTKVKVKKTVII